MLGAAGGDGLPVRLSSRNYAGTRDGAVRDLGFDQPLAWVAVALLAWGLVMVYSASVALPDNPRFANYAQTHFLIRHTFSIAVGLIAALVAFQFPLRAWERMAPWLFALALLLLVLVLIPFIGKGVNGARRWISLGVMNFQPSELAKLAVLLYAADYMVRKMDVKERFFQAVAPMGVAVLVVGMLLLAEPDMGAFMVIVVIAMGILFLGGVNARMFFLIALLAVTAFAVMIMLSDWRRERIFAYLDPWSEEHALGKGYQLSHSLIAIGRGELFGVGLGGSVEKLHWLPEAHTDFLLAVIGEEFGLVGLLVLIALFLWLTRRIMHIGRQAIALDQVFAGLVAQGVGLWFGFQAFINIGVNLGALPTKGLTLPFMSYGGSAILLNMVALAIVLRVDYENRQLMRGART
ncbi:putative lipid II flippase FtsW [uncultured Hydrogenophaga sp.]|uniref:putative lipid II flippase FtsW n=1 Tax=uncultured Hydrogenophaga sp. TaxID=199683 RepID=UPI003749D913